MRDERFNEIEKLAIAQMLYNRIGEYVSTKTPGNLRSEVDQEMTDLYERFGAKTCDVKLLGVKVGTYSITPTPSKPSWEEDVLAIEDRQELMAWAFTNGYLKLDMEAIQAHFNSSGEIPDGCKVEKIIHPEVVGGGIQRTTLRIDGDKVQDVLKGHLPDAAIALLGGGEDEL